MEFIMKKLGKMPKLIILVFFLIAVGMLCNANAAIIEITPTTQVGFPISFDDLSNSGVNSGEEIEALITDRVVVLNIVYSAKPADGSESFLTWLCDTEFSPEGDVSEATITPSGPSNLYGGDELWLLVKDGADGHYLFDLFNLIIGGVPYRWDGTDTLRLSGFYPDQGSISHIAMYSNIPRIDIPETGSLILMGIGIVCLATYRFGMKKFKK